VELLIEQINPMIVSSHRIGASTGPKERGIGLPLFRLATRELFDRAARRADQPTRVN
jgi:hypothetical protein